MCCCIFAMLRHLQSDVVTLKLCRDNVLTLGKFETRSRDIGEIFQTLCHNISFDVVTLSGSLVMSV